MREFLSYIWTNLICMTILPEFVWRGVIQDNLDFSTYSEYFQNVQDYLGELHWKNYKK